MVAKQSGRIIGGRTVPIRNVPWQVSITYFGRHHCGGSIVSIKHIMTAAHCTHKMSPAAFSIRAGSSMRNYGGTKYAILKIYQHPKYNEGVQDCDLSIILLSTVISFSHSIRAIALPGQDESLTVGSMATISGWGAKRETVQMATYQLRYASVPILDERICIDAYRRRRDNSSRVTSNMICAGFVRGGIDACQGDSGGPLVVNSKLFGIVSWGFGCGQANFPGVYTRVAKFRNWVDSVLALG